MTIAERMASFNIDGTILERSDLRWLLKRCELQETVIEMLKTKTWMVSDEEWRKALDALAAWEKSE